MYLILYRNGKKRCHHDSKTENTKMVGKLVKLFFIVSNTNTKMVCDSVLKGHVSSNPLK
jgi:hypothetical protein